jgi:ribonuclease BN (tRNA processing enzyme)
LDKLTEQCRNADILIHDAQYIEADMPLKHGWGHSLISQVTKLGESAEVKNLVYYHHDPERSDDDIDAELEKASKVLKEKDSSVIPYFAYEGLRLTL